MELLKIYLKIYRKLKKLSNPEKCKFPKYEQNYANLAHELKDFAEIAEDLIGESAWGLFSGVFGKSTNA